MSALKQSVNSFTRSDALGYDLDAASRLGNTTLTPGLSSLRRFAASQRYGRWSQFNYYRSLVHSIAWFCLECFFGW